MAKYSKREANTRLVAIVGIGLAVLFGGILLFQTLANREKTPDEKMYDWARQTLLRAGFTDLYVSDIDCLKDAVMKNVTPSEIEELMKDNVPRELSEVITDTERYKQIQMDIVDVCADRLDLKD